MLILTSFVARLAHAIVSRIAKKSRLRVSLQDLILQLLSVGIWTVGLLLAALTPVLATGLVCVKRIYVEDVLGDEPA